MGRIWIDLDESVCTYWRSRRGRLNCTQDLLGRIMWSIGGRTNVANFRTRVICKFRRGRLLGATVEYWLRRCQHSPPPHSPRVCRFIIELRVYVSRTTIHCHCLGSPQQYISAVSMYSRCTLSLDGFNCAKKGPITTQSWLEGS